jgi:hypothetical protein
MSPKCPVCSQSPIGLSALAQPDALTADGEQVLLIKPAV